MSEGFAPDGGLPEQRVVVIRNAVEVPDDKGQPLPGDQRQRMLADLGFPRDAKVVGYVGRIARQKRVDDLIWAAELLRRIDDRAWFLIAGDGPERDHLERLAAQLGLHDRVTFWGWLSHADLLTRMAQAHMFVLASRADPQTGETEGTPTVLLEAQALGLPVVSTRHADIPYIVQHGVSGILVPAGDAASLAEALDTLLRRPDRWPTMGAAGRAYVAAHHDVRHVAARLETIYDEVRQNGGKP